MSGPGDIGGEVSGDEAAWRDLIARFDTPADRTGVSSPWPASEDLPDAPGGQGEGTDAAAEPPGSPSDPAGPSAEYGRRPAAHRGDPAAHRGDPAAHRGDPAAHRGDPAAHRGDPAAHGADSAANGADSAEPQGGLDPGGQADQVAGSASQPANPATSFTIPTDRTRVIRPAGDPRSYTPAEEQDEPYVPEPLPPPAKLDSVTKGALAGVIGGPGYLLIVSIFLHWTISAETALIAIAAFVAGFVTLVVKLGDRSGRDDDDDGAVL
jgi:hypothetical protein